MQSFCLLNGIHIYHRGLLQYYSVDSQQTFQANTKIPKLHVHELEENRRTRTILTAETAANLLDMYTNPLFTKTNRGKSNTSFTVENNVYDRRLAAMFKTPTQATANSAPGLNYRITVGL
jgi:hypothetical protein